MNPFQKDIDTITQTFFSELTYYCFILFSIDPDISVTTPKDPEIDNGITDNPWSFTTPGPTTVSTTYRQCALPTLPGKY